MGSGKIVRVARQWGTKAVMDHMFVLLQETDDEEARVVKEALTQAFDMPYIYTKTWDDNQPWKWGIPEGEK